MKVQSIRRSTVWYVVTDLLWKQYGRRIQRIRDVRLYEVSHSLLWVGMLVAGADEADAEATVRDILQSYSVIVPGQVFEVVKATSRSYGYSIKAPAHIKWAMGPGNTFGWYRRKGDAQRAADAHNRGDTK